MTEAEHPKETNVIQLVSIMRKLPGADKSDNQYRLVFNGVVYRLQHFGSSGSRRIWWKPWVKVPLPKDWRDVYNFFHQPIETDDKAYMEKLVKNLNETAAKMHDWKPV